MRSEAALLQRRKSVRLFGPIKEPTCCMEEDRMRRVFIEENCETLAKVSADIAFLQYVTVDSALRHFSFPGF